MMINNIILKYMADVIDFLAYIQIIAVLCLCAVYSKQSEEHGKSLWYVQIYIYGKNIQIYIIWYVL